MSTTADILARQQAAERRQIAEILHKQKKLVRKGKQIDLFNDPQCIRVMKLAERGYSTEAICNAVDDMTPGMVQLRLNRAKMTWTAGLGMDRRAFRNGTSLLAQREIKEILRKPELDPLLIKHLDKYAVDRDQKRKKK